MRGVLHPYIAIIVQARMGATRLPGKPLKCILNRPLLSYLIERLKRVSLADSLIIATTTKAQDQPIVDLCKQEKVKVIKGSENNVLSRYIKAAKSVGADIVVRITADCPLMDPRLIEEALQQFLAATSPLDYLSNTLQRTYPRGMDIEIMKTRALEQTYSSATTSAEKEHVTLHLYRHPELFQIANFCYEKDVSHFRFTVDTTEDFELIKKILETLYPRQPQFNLEDILNLMQANPLWIKINEHIQQKQV